ncbi:MAG TPA: hypothetical protein VFW40_04570, partial [Capsulimonadaceae bacterium]|nr:hypothetical protein [Capsulimonadaceae bacterium]
LHKPGALKVFRGRCPNLIRTLPLMTYDERLGHLEDLDTSLEDHNCDALRYALMTRPRPGIDPDAPPYYPPPVEKEPDHRPQWLKRKTSKPKI